MKAVIFGLILITAAVVAVLPQGLDWWPEVVAFFRGGLPVLAVLIGFLALFVGIADIKDRLETKKEEKEAGKTE